MAFNSTDVFLTLGRRGSGKSYLARGISKAYPRRVIFDLLGEYSYSDGSVVSSYEGLSKKILETRDAREFTLIYQFDIEKESHGPEFEHALRLLWHRGNILVLIEEIQHFASPHSMPLWLRNILLTGRHRHVAAMFTTQRPGECHKTILSQSNHVFCGSLHEKNDVEYVRSVLGDRAYELPQLPEREFLYFQPGKPIRRVDNDLRDKG